MSTLLVTHPACLKHEMGAGHAESPARLASILGEFGKPEFLALQCRKAPQATMEQLALAHDRAYIAGIFERLPQRGYVHLDPDTALSPGSGEAALLAAGAVIAAVDDVAEGRVQNAFCAVRPPGHHAEYAAPMGFCLFNNIAIGAAYAAKKHGLNRVAIVDFDVHHGNGTQDWAAEQKDVLFFSSHQFPLWPGTGRAQEKGPHGNIVNVPLPPGAGSAEFRRAMEASVFPAIDRFRPELLMISAGFDAHRADPLAGLNFETEDYGWVTRELCRLAQTHCGGKVVSTLEGGYDLEALAASAGAHVKALMEAA